MRAADVGALMLAVNRFSDRQAAIVAKLRSQLDDSLAQLRNDLQPVIMSGEPEADTDLHSYEAELYSEDLLTRFGETEVHARDVIAALNAAERWAKRAAPAQPRPWLGVVWLRGSDGCDVRFLIALDGEVRS